MIIKLYEKAKKSIKENHNFILFLILFVMVLHIKVPYVIERPGGIDSLNGSVKINGKNLKGDFNTSYVSVGEGNVISFLMSFIMPNWDLVKSSDYSNKDLSYKEIFELERISMNQSQDFAVKYVFDKLELPYEIKKEKLYVYYKIDDIENDLNYGDQIIKCDQNELNYFTDLSKCIEDSNGVVDLLILRNDKEKEIKADVFNYGNKRIIGVGIYRDIIFESKYDIEFKNDSSESGPSGGFMTALALFDNLTGNKLNHNLKIAGTGTIEEDGSVGEIGGIKYKLLGAEKNKVDVFFVPKDNFKEAKKVVKKYKLKINIVKVDTLDDAIDYLSNYKTKK